MGEKLFQSLSDDHTTRGLTDAAIDTDNIRLMSRKIFSGEKSENTIIYIQ